MRAVNSKSKKNLGNSGEALVCIHLKRLGWHILEEKYRSPFGEIDVIASEPSQNGSVLVFMEVKSRTGSEHGSPAEAVDLRKQQKLSATARHYLSERASGGEEPACRFDIAEVLYDSAGLASISIMRSAFEAR